jgi:hypothetical protein
MAERHPACDVAERRRKERDMPRSLVIDAGLDKLQTLLLEMEVGDQVSVPQAMHGSGLRAAQCEAVLDALARAGLMIRGDGDTYIRRHPADSATGT